MFALVTMKFFLRYIVEISVTTTSMCECFWVFFSDECASNPCVNEGSCVDRVNGFSCTCGRGYSGDFCQLRSSAAVCFPSLCQGGVCVDDYRNNKAVCVCYSGYRLSKSSCQCIEIQYFSSHKTHGDDTIY